MYAHTIHAQDRHYGWDRTLPPVLEIEPEAVVELDVTDAGDGQITPSSTSADLETLDPTRANPVNGPIRVIGAEPHDALIVEVLGLEGCGWGWTGLIPGFGLLSDEFKSPHLVISRYDGHKVSFLPGIEIPQRAFPGTVGLAPSAPGRHSVIPPRRMGGNMDYRGLVEGARVFLPVEVEGALLSLGDPHAAQGHGEVCGTAIETSMRVQVRCSLARERAPRFPRFELPAPSLARNAPVWSTSGIGPDLFQAARDAVREMIDLLMAEHGLSAEDAYCLSSIAADLVVAEVVDAPNWMVVFELPRDIFV